MASGSNRYEISSLQRFRVWKQVRVRGSGGTRGSDAQRRLRVRARAAHHHSADGVDDAVHVGVGGYAGHGFGSSLMPLLTAQLLQGGANPLDGNQPYDLEGNCGYFARNVEW